jgi:outer membrane protein TolC
LQGYISKGLQNNLDIRIAMQNIVAAQATMKQGKAGYFPSLSVGTTGRIKCCLKTVSLEHSFKIGVQINTNCRKPFLGS